MKIKGLLLMVVVTMFVLSACGNGVGAAPVSAGEIISSANTTVALTSVSQLQMENTSTATSTATPTATFTPRPLTPLPTMTTVALIRPIDIQPIDAEPASTPNYSPSAGISNCDSSTYVSDVSISDGTVFSPGETFTKTWKIQNTGTSTWNSNYAISFSSGNDMSGTTTALRRVIPPNGTSNVSVELIAPEKEGTYTGYWMMTNSSGTPFGCYVYVQIVVLPDESTSEEEEASN